MTQPVQSRASLHAGRQLWVAVVERRREWARQAGEGHWEGLPAADRRWLGELEDVVTVARGSITGGNDVDPRAALIDVMALCAGWIEQMG